LFASTIPSLLHIIMSPPYAISDWQAEAAKARQSVFDSIPEDWRLPSTLLTKATEGSLKPDDPDVLACGILSALDQEITSILDVDALLGALAQGTYSAVQVTTAFCKRAAIAHQCTSCLTCFFPLKALQRAAELDAAGASKGPLHGLPVSLKDIYDVVDQPSTIGLVSWLPNVAKSNSTVADAILAAGGVLYAKTGTSQACLMVESINNIFGAIRNPYNLSLNPGGSSGGEGALLAARGGVLGSGTDGGGSIRFPAMFCGLWGLKCSKGRVSGGGMASTYDGNESTNAGLGPMSSSVSGLGVWMQAVLANNPWKKDMNCLPMPWDVKAAERPQDKLRFAVLWDDGVVEPTPPVTVSKFLN
jgi:amidase